MSANVFAFPGRGKGPQPWTNDELAELYRVVDLLGRAGLSVATDMGMSDEGDPWFVFCRVDNDEVIAHFARIDGVFVAASIAVDETFRGANFRQIVDRMVSSQPLVMPRPNSGSKLFLHPAVMLTAFVATALAHSQKTQALDWLHAVEAQWGHNKAALLTEIKHIKTGWLDTLHTLWKLPLHDDKLVHDTKEGPLTLASLIAIALAALQPITDKVAVISHLVSEELQGHSASASQQASAHAAQLMQDMAMGDGSDSGGDHGGGGNGGGGGHGNGHGGDGSDGNTPELHKVAAAVPTITDNSVDAQHAAVDASHLAALSAVQKTSTDDFVHAAAYATDASADNGAFLLMQQKAVVMAQQVQAQQTAPVQTETYVFLSDSGSATTQAISASDVTTQALQALIHKTTDSSGGLSSGSSLSGDDSTSSSHVTGTSTDSAGASSSIDGGTSTTLATTTASTTPLTPTNLVVDDVDAPLNTVIQAISNFVNTDSHLVSNAASLTVNTALQQQLESYFTASTSSLKVVFFDATSSSVPDVFLFSTGVVFVEEKDISPNLHLTNGGGNLILQVDSQGGTVTLVGVATIEQQHTVSA